MRNYLTLLIILAFVGFLNAQVAPKKSNLIIIKSSDKIDDSFKKIGRILMDEGYELETADKTFYSISTKITHKNYGLMGGGSLELKFFFQFDQIQDTTVIIFRGRVNSNQLAVASGMKHENFEKDAIRIENRGATGSIIKSSWELMENIAKRYSPCSIGYKEEIDK